MPSTSCDRISADALSGPMVEPRSLHSGDATKRIHVQVLGGDPIVHVGITAQLAETADLVLTASGPDSVVDVTLVVSDILDAACVSSVGSAVEEGPVVIVASVLDGPGVLEVMRAGACGVLRRSEAVGDRLAEAVRGAAAGRGTVPADVLNRLLVGHHGPGQLRATAARPGDSRTGDHSGLTEREIRVLQLAADGLSTREIASSLAFSERTIKNALHDATVRLRLRNRVQAVAFAVRQGLI